MASVCPGHRAMVISREKRGPLACSYYADLRAVVDTVYPEGSCRPSRVQLIRKVEHDVTGEIGCGGAEGLSHPWVRPGPNYTADCASPGARCG